MTFCTKIFDISCTLLNEFLTSSKSIFFCSAQLRYDPDSKGLIYKADVVLNTTAH